MGWVPREVRAKQQGRQEDRKMRILAKELNNTGVKLWVRNSDSGV